MKHAHNLLFLCFSLKHADKVHEGKKELKREKRSEDCKRKNTLRKLFYQGSR
jgi:hypothetical protein